MIWIPRKGFEKSYFGFSCVGGYYNQNQQGSLLNCNKLGISPLPVFKAFKFKIQIESVIATLQKWFHFVKCTGGNVS